MGTTTRHERSRVSKEYAPQNSEGLGLWGFGRAFIDLGWACIFAILIVGFYFRIAGFGLWPSLVVLVALVVLARTKLPMQAVDWSVLLVVSFEIATLPFSQYSANSVRIPVAPRWALLALLSYTFLVPRP